MSRSGYTEDGDGWALIRWRGAVASAIRGKRGQQFLKELLNALDAMPEKKLIAEELSSTDGVCAIGSVGKSRGIDMSVIDPDDYDQVVKAFGIPEALVREIEFINDEYLQYPVPTPEKRFEHVRRWVSLQIKQP